MPRPWPWWASSPITLLLCSARQSQAGACPVPDSLLVSSPGGLLGFSIRGAAQMRAPCWGLLASPSSPPPPRLPDQCSQLWKAYLGG